MTAEEVEERAGSDFAVVDELLAQAPFLTGAAPTAADCFLFALLDLVRPPPSVSQLCLLYTSPSPRD